MNSAKANTFIKLNDHPVVSQNFFWETSTGTSPFIGSIRLHETHNSAALESLNNSMNLIHWVRVSSNRATSSGKIGSQLSFPVIPLKGDVSGEFYQVWQLADIRYLWKFGVYSAQINMMRKVNNILRPPIGEIDGEYQRAGVGSSDNFLANQAAQFNERRYLEQTLNPVTNEPWTALQLVYMLLRNWLRVYEGNLDLLDPKWWATAYQLPDHYYDVTSAGTTIPSYNPNIENNFWVPQLILDDPPGELENNFPLLNVLYDQKPLDLILRELCQFGRLELYCDGIGNIHLRKADSEAFKPTFSPPPEIVANSSRILNNRIKPRSLKNSRPHSIISTCKNKFEVFYYYDSDWDLETSTTPITENKYGLTRMLVNVLQCPHDEKWEVDGSDYFVRAGEWHPIKYAISNWGFDIAAQYLTNIIPTDENLGVGDAAVRYTWLNGGLMKKAIEMYMYDVSEGNQPDTFYQGAAGKQLDPAKATKRHEAIRRHWRTTWRIYPDDMKLFRTIETKMASKLDPALGNYQPSEVYLDYARKFTERQPLREVAEFESWDIEQAKEGGNFDFNINLPGPYTASVLDPYLGIIKIAPIADDFTGLGATTIMFPFQLENLQGLNPRAGGVTDGAAANLAYVKAKHRIGIPITVEFLNTQKFRQDLYYTGEEYTVTDFSNGEYSGTLPSKVIYTDLVNARFAFKRTGSDESIVGQYPMADVTKPEDIPINDYEVSEILGKAANLAFQGVRDDIAGTAAWEGLYLVKKMVPLIRSIRYTCRRNGACSTIFNARDSRVIEQFSKDLPDVIRQFVYGQPRDYRNSRWEK